MAVVKMYLFQVISNKTIKMLKYSSDMLYKPHGYLLTSRSLFLLNVAIFVHWTAAGYVEPPKFSITCLWCSF